MKHRRPRDVRAALFALVLVLSAWAFFCWWLAAALLHLLPKPGLHPSAPPP